MKDDKWIRIKKLMALLTSILLWIVSIIFSYKGFNLSSEGNWWWVGIVMAVSITVLELIFNTNTTDDLVNNKSSFGEWILVIGGVLAYIYDIWTNILGLYAARNAAMPSISHIGADFVIPFVVGAFIAILPEPLFVWGLSFKPAPKAPEKKHIPYVPPVVNNKQPPSPDFAKRYQELLGKMKEESR